MKYVHESAAAMIDSRVGYFAFCSGVSNICIPCIEFERSVICQVLGGGKLIKCYIFLCNTQERIKNILGTVFDTASSHRGNVTWSAVAGIVEVVFISESCIVYKWCTKNSS